MGPVNFLVVLGFWNRLRFVLGLCLIGTGFGFWLVSSFGVAAFLVGLFFIVLGIAPFSVDLARLLATPWLNFINGVYLPGGHGKRPPLNLDLPLYYERYGREEEAVDAYEAMVRHYPREPRPYARLLRLHRDVFDDEEAAAFWLKRGRRYVAEEVLLDEAAKTPQQLFMEKPVTLFGMGIPVSRQALGG